MATFQFTFSVKSRLDHFDLAIDAEFNCLVTGIFGVSGAGKTTLFTCLAGLKKDAEGIICFNGVDWLNSDRGIFLAPEHRRIGYVPQNGLLFPNKNVKENLLLASHRQVNNGAVSLESVCELLELNSLLERSVLSLSGGERQRVALGRAICSDPDLLLLDEPLAALDLKLKRQILPFLRRIRDELEIPMIMISHNPAEIQALCDEVLVIQQGKKIAFGPTQKILLDPQILSLTHGEHYENIFPATVLDNPIEGENEHNSSVLTIGIDIPKAIDDIKLVTPYVNLPAGKKLMVGIPANDIMLATHKPQGISAQNIILAKISSVERINGKFMVSTSLDDTSPDDKGLELSAEISPQALHELDLKIGEPVFLVIKSTSCIIYQ